MYPEEVLEEVDRWAATEEWVTFAERASDLVGSLDRLGFYPEIRQRLEAARDAAEQHDLPPKLQA